MSALTREWQERIFLVSAALVVCTLPFSIRLNSLSLVLLGVVYVLEGEWQAKYQRLIRNKLALLFIGLYVIHLIALIYSSNIRQGFMELEKKAGFVVFPVIFATTSYLNGRMVVKLLYCFVASCLMAAIICIVNGLYFYFRGDSTYLFYHNLGAVIKFDHAIYFSFYIALSIFILLIYLKKKWERLSFFEKTLITALIVFFFIFLILLSSKMIIAAVFVLLIFVRLHIRFRQKDILTGVLALLASVTILLSVIFTVPNIRERFKVAFIADREQVNPLFLDDYYLYHFTPANIRLAIWKLTIEIMKEENAWLLGVGTGDSQDLLTAKYVEKHVYPGDPTLGTYGFHHYNAHNQFLQFFLMFGIIGLAWFVAILWILFKKSVINGEASILFFLLVLFTAFCLTESVLHVQKGIVFFLFFSSLLSRPFGYNESPAP